jgi:hypothetical protein
MSAKTHDSSIPHDTVIYRGIKPSELALDVHGNPVISDGAFRSRELSGFRADRASVNGVFREYPSAFRVAEITVREIIDAGCIVVTDEPPQGHVNIYRGDKPGDRISGSAAGRMAKRARLNPSQNPLLAPKP